LSQGRAVQPPLPAVPLPRLAGNLFLSTSAQEDDSRSQAVVSRGRAVPGRRARHINLCPPLAVPLPGVSEPGACRAGAVVSAEEDDPLALAVIRHRGLRAR